MYVTFGFQLAYIDYPGLCHECFRSLIRVNCFRKLVEVLERPGAVWAFSLGKLHSHA